MSFTFFLSFSQGIEIVADQIINCFSLDVNFAVSAIIDLYQRSASHMRLKTGKKQTTTNQPWWDEECETAKYLKYSALRIFRNTNAVEDYDTYIDKCNHFRSICKQKKTENIRRKIGQI